jgi:guanine deaminase
MHEDYMKEAIEISQDKMRKNEGGPFGAVIVKDGKVIARGWNQVTSSNDPTAHAEVVAIRKACHELETFHLEGCTIYTSCEPCPMCLASIYWAHIDKIYYGNTRDDAAAINFDDEFLYREIATPLEKRSIPTAPLLRDEANKVFKEWMDKSDKVEY